jgi:hypothetical protein
MAKPHLGNNFYKFWFWNTPLEKQKCLKGHFGVLKPTFMKKHRQRAKNGVQ